MTISSDGGLLLSLLAADSELSVDMVWVPPASAPPLHESLLSEEDAMKDELNCSWHLLATELKKTGIDGDPFACNTNTREDLIPCLESGEWREERSALPNHTMPDLRLTQKACSTNIVIGSDKSSFSPWRMMLLASAWWALGRGPYDSHDPRQPREDTTAASPTILYRFRSSLKFIRKVT